MYICLYTKLGNFAFPARKIETVLRPMSSNVIINGSELTLPTIRSAL